jgi:hypothetical protein
MKLSLYSRDGFSFSQDDEICKMDGKDKKACINFVLKTDNLHDTGSRWYITDENELVVYNKSMYKGIPDFIQFIKEREERGIY